MAERSGVFNSSAGDRKYTSANLAEGFLTFLHGESGVIKGAENSLSLASGAGYATTLATGRAVWLGRWYVNDAAKTMTSDAVTILNKRIDRIVIRMDPTTARSMAATIIKGTETTGTPSAPALGANDVALYQVLFDNTTGAPTQALTDERDYCYVGNASSLFGDGWTKSTDGTFAGNSDLLLPTQKAAKTYVDTLLATAVNTTHGTDFLTGSGNWTCPAGVRVVHVVMGGGGGGGGAGVIIGTVAGGGGGGAGGVIMTSIAVIPGNVYAYVCGTGGAGATATQGVNGTNGNNTTFSSLTALGGSGGGAAPSGVVGTGGAGGVIAAGLGISGSAGSNGSGSSGGAGGAGTGYILASSTGGQAGTGPVTPAVGGAGGAGKYGGAGGGGGGGSSGGAGGAAGAGGNGSIMLEY